MRQAIAHGRTEATRSQVYEDQQHLAAIVRIDQARAVHQRQAVLCRQARPGKHETCHAVRQRDGKARARDGSLPRFETHRIDHMQIKARIA